jgi:phospholipase/lecithinase/hemolysin
MTFLSARAVAFAKPWLFSFILIIGLLAPGFASADGHRPFSRIVVFGDSLSDPGNAVQRDGFVQAPDYGMLSDPLTFLTRIPDAPYKEGRFRFSNGLTWIEQLAAAAGLSRNARPAFYEARNGASNYAFGGARARDGVAGEVWLSQQVSRFLQDVGPHAPSRALYVVQIGGNDLRDALFAVGDAGGDPAAAGPIVGAAIFYIGEAIRNLYKEGARHFLVWNVPNLGRTPAILALEGSGAFPGAAAGATMIATSYNTLLGLKLAELSADPDLAGVDILPFDAYEKLEGVLNDPERYFLQNVEETCIVPGPSLPARCTNPDGYFFWDGIHPTRAGHARIAFLVGKALITEALQD